MKNYNVKIERYKKEKPSWDYQKVEIFKGDEKIFEFIRKYSWGAKNTTTFFERDGVDYMLYSENYVDISILNLNSLEHRELKLYEKDGVNSGTGFCPVNIWVPNVTDESVKDDYWYEDEDTYYLKFAIVQGCVWGCDTYNYDVRVLDLRDLDNITYLKDSWTELSYQKGLDIRKDININVWGNEDNGISIYVPTPKEIEFK